MYRLMTFGLVLVTGGIIPSIGTRASADPDRPGTAAVVGRGRHPDSVKKPLRLSRTDLSSGFEVNVGQLDSRADVVARQGNLLVYLSAGDALLRVPDRADAVQIRLVGRNRRPAVQPLDPRPAKANYFRGSNPRNWHSNISTYSRVRYPAVYRGIDLVYYFDGTGQLEHDFIVGPGANAGAIRFRIEGARRIQIDNAGDLQLHLAEGAITLRRPVMSQVDGGRTQRVAGRYVMKGRRDVGFEIGNYDRTRPLRIDPVVHATYLGGAGNDTAMDVAVDADGNAYVTGYTASVDFPVVNAWQPHFKGWADAFVAKFDAAGSLQYCTYLGGVSDDKGQGIAVGSGGTVHVVGETHTPVGMTTDFPTTPGAFQRDGKYVDAFVAKFDATGVLIASTLFGGTNADEGSGLAIDTGGNSYITGSTTSPDLLLLSPIQPVYGGNGDAFAAKLNADLTTLVYSTFVGGQLADYGYGAAVDSEGRMTVVGVTASADFPTAGAFQPGRAGSTDGFVATLHPSGSAFVFSTYLGGALPEGDDEATGVAIDEAGNIVVGGSTNCSDLPGARDSSISGSPAPVNGLYERDAFVAKLSASGALLFSTYVGGGGLETLDDIALDAAGSVYVTGLTRSTSFPRAGDRLADVGAYTTGDGGEVWNSVKGGLDSASITALVIDPAAPATLFAGTEKDGVFKSTDGGATWYPSNNGLWSAFITGLVIDPMNTSTLYAATDGRWGTAGAAVFKTIDAGATWTWAASGIAIRHTLSLAIDPSNPSTVYVGTLMRGAHRLYKTINGGGTWSPVLYLEVPALAVDPSSSDTVYAASSVFLYKTVNGGSTWNTVFTEATHLARLTAVLVDPTSPSTIYVGTSGKGVFKSIDGGSTWAAASTGLSGGYVSALALDRRNPATLYAGTYDRGVFKSADGGATWRASNTGITDVEVTQIAVDPQASGNVHIGVNGLHGDAYLAILTAQGAIAYSARTGGSRFDSGLGIASTPAGTVHVVGWTRSRDWPASANATGTAFGGGSSDGFASRLECVAPLALSSIRVNRDVLWPPDHRMVSASLEYQVAGACGAVTCSVSVASNEPVNGTGDGDAEPDWEVIDSRRATLRAERAGYGIGRKYSLTVTCADATGREASGTQAVVVPINSR